MKSAQIKELRTKTSEELIKDLRDMRGEVSKLVIDMKTGKSENLNALKIKRKDIARILTFLSEKNNEVVLSEKNNEVVLSEKNNEVSASEKKNDNTVPENKTEKTI